MIADPTSIPPQLVDRGEILPPYKARKPPTALRVKLCGFETGILVLRCHDLDVANVVAFGEILAAGGRDDPAFVAFATGEPAVPVWVRWVPDEYGVPDSPGVWERELRGTIGATPAVLFAREVPT